MGKRHEKCNFWVKYAFGSPSKKVSCDFEKKIIKRMFSTIFDHFRPVLPKMNNFDQIWMFWKNNEKSHIWAAIYEKSSLNNNNKGLNRFFEMVNFFLHSVILCNILQKQEETVVYESWALSPDFWHVG